MESELVLLRRKIKGASFAEQVGLNVEIKKTSRKIQVHRETVAVIEYSKAMDEGID